VERSLLRKIPNGYWRNRNSMNITRLLVSTIYDDPNNLCYKVNYESDEGGGQLLLVYRLYNLPIAGGTALIALDATTKVPVALYLAKNLMLNRLREKYSCPVREL
jgi:hypothetical protein